MSSKEGRSGGKYAGNHTTLVPAAATVCDELERMSAVSKISPGFITAGLRSTRGKRRVKIVDEGSRLLLTVRDNTSQQELHIYTDGSVSLRQRLKDALEARGFLVTQKGE